MSTIVEWTYNPYLSCSKVLINGNAVPSYSILTKYLTLPIYRWCEVIFDELFRDFNDDYIFIFTGRESDEAVLRMLAEENPRCQRFVYVEPEYPLSLQSRMTKLHNYIKLNRCNVLQQDIRLHFLLNDPSYAFILNELEVSNSFCKISTQLYSDIISEFPNDYLFVIGKGSENQIRKNSYRYIFLIDDTIEKNHIKGGVYYCKTITWDRSDVFDALFHCLLFIPLCETFASCTNTFDISGSQKELFKLFSISKPISVNIPEIVEKGRTTPIIVSKKQDGTYPDLIFSYDIPDIIKCNTSVMEGINEGKVRVNVFEKGMPIPFYTRVVNVESHKVIERLILCEKSLIVGVGDRIKLSVDAYPEDAENISEIQWLSTKPQIADVSNTGILDALSVGECQIICYAGNIQTRMLVTIFPHLEKFEIENELEDGILRIPLQGNFPLMIKAVPADAMDRNYNISIDDMYIVNAVNDTLHPVSVGSTKVILSNSSKTVSISINVEVYDQEKHRLFKKRKLFHRKNKT